MVDKQLIIDTINELLDANVDKDTIISTLKDIGVDQGDIDTNYKEVMESRKNKKAEEKPKTEETKVEEEKTEEKPKQEETKVEEEKTEEKTKQEEKKVEEEKTAEDTGENITESDKETKEQKSNKIDNNIKKIINEGVEKHQKDLEETSENINQINNDHEQIKENINKLNSEKQIDYSEQLSKMQDDLIEIKAKMNALTKIMKDILEENRNIINKL